MHQITYSRVVHLSHVIDRNIPLWPGDPRVELDYVGDPDAYGYQLGRLCIGEHSGTHVNAPRAFDGEGLGVDRMKAGTLVGPAIVIDIRPSAADNSDYAISVDDIVAWESVHGRIRPGSFVLLFTGWQEHWLNPDAFLGVDSDMQPHFPGFGLEAGRWLLNERQVAGLGTDTHGLEPGIDSTFSVNRLVLGQQGIALENLANLGQIPAVGATVVIGALRLKNGTGSPAAVLALVP